MTPLRRIQFTAVAIHSVVLLWLIYWFVFVSNPHDHMVGFAWFAVLGWPDVPASATWLLLQVLFSEFFDSVDASFAATLHHAYPFDWFSGFWTPIVLYGTIGTYWWWTLPAVFAWLTKRLRAITRRNPC